MLVDGVWLLLVVFRCDCVCCLLFVVDDDWTCWLSLVARRCMLRVGCRALLKFVVRCVLCVVWRLVFVGCYYVLCVAQCALSGVGCVYIVDRCRWLAVV